MKYVYLTKTAPGKYRPGVMTIRTESGGARYILVVRSPGSLVNKLEIYYTNEKSHDHGLERFLKLLTCDQAFAEKKYT